MSEELVVVPANAVEVFNPEAMTSFLEHVRAEATSVVFDANKNEGRNGIRSMAFKIAKTKTALDSAGKKLVEPLKEQAKLVDSERKRAKDYLEALQDEVRKPLTEWEEKEKSRTSAITERIAAIRAIGESTYADSVSAKSAQAKLAELSAFDFQEQSEAAKQQMELCGFRLDKAVSELTERERIAAEAERLAEEAAKKVEAERIEREAKERKEREERIASEAAERARLAAEAKAEAARVAEAAKVERERAEREREAQRKIDEERKRNEELVRSAERAKVAAENAARIERERIEAERKAEEDARSKREADKAYRGKILTEAKDALAAIIGEEPAKLAIRAIHAGNIPHTSIEF